LNVLSFQSVKEIQEINDCDIGLKSYELLKTNVNECMEAGLFPRTNIDVAAFSLWSYVHGIASLIIRGRGIMFPEERIKYIVEEALNFMLVSNNKKKCDLKSKQTISGVDL
jgi:hypothetical protein